MFNAASPFGGYKQSGYGREMGRHALDLYTQVKSVWVDLSGRPDWLVRKVMTMPIADCQLSMFPGLQSAICNRNGNAIIYEPLPR